MTDAKEIGDSYAMASSCAQRVGRYEEGEMHATACIEHSRLLDSGSYLHGLSWRVPARFRLGDWDGVLADQAEIERVAALDPRELPAGYTVRAYTHAALCHELRGEHEDADRYIELTHRYSSRNSAIGCPGRHAASAAVRARAGATRPVRRGARLHPTRSAQLERGVTLEALCEIAALPERWEEAPGLVATTREEDELGEEPLARILRRPARGSRGRRSR